MGRLLVLGCVVSLREVIIILPARMEGSESDVSLISFKGTPNKFVMQRTGHRDARSLQAYQRPSKSSRIERSVEKNLP